MKDEEYRDTHGSLDLCIAVIGLLMVLLIASWSINYCLSYL